MVQCALTGAGEAPTRQHPLAGGNDMTHGIGFPDRKLIAELTAKMLLEVEAVQFSEGKPYIFTSGLASPVYTDCRRLISFPRIRQTLMDFGVATVFRDIGFESLDAVAGGETAGIPFAAWMAERLGLPMQYVRKKPKGFGRNAQIEGHLVAGQRTLLVEDLATDGGSKVNFCRALREAGAQVDHVFVVFYYDIFPDGGKLLDEMGVKLHALATWWDVLAYARSKNLFGSAMLAEAERFMKDPRGWSIEHGGTSGSGAD
jgi:orotate phosphoribosyltransferase